MAKRKPRAATSPGNLIGAGLMVASILGAVGVWFLGADSDETPTPGRGDATNSAFPSGGPVSNSAATASVDNPPKAISTAVPTGKTYRPGVSDNELAAFLERLRAEQGDEAEAQLTEQQIIDIMGPPTKSEPPVTGRKNGQVFTVKQLRWEHHTPAKDYSTLVTIINGRFAGGVIGLEVTPLQTAGTSSQSTPSPAPSGTAPPPPSAPTGPLADWVVGVWEGQLAASLGIGPRKLRVEFRKSGELVVRSEPRAPDDFDATWRVERTEGNNLWILFDVTRVNGQPGPNPGRSILITRQDDGTFSSRAFQPPDAVEFRRVAGGR